MDHTSDLTRIKELVEKVNDILIVSHDRPTFDSIGSSLALYLGLLSLGKKVTVASPDPMTVALSSFVGVNKIISDLGKKNFIISLDYVDGAIEKVSYNIEGDKFNLVIEPRVGFESFSPEKVHYNYATANFDLIFAVDTIHLGGLGKLYEGEKDLFASKTLVNIDHHPNNAHYGGVNLLDPTAAATAELVGILLTDLGLKLTSDMATNLLNALYGATNSFQSTVTAGAFELAATCLKAGGRRFSSLPPVEEIPQTETVAMVEPKVRSEVATPVVAHPESTQAPSDWLKPKIFKSSSSS